MITHPLQPLKATVPAEEPESKTQLKRAETARSRSFGSRQSDGPPCRPAGADKKAGSMAPRRSLSFPTLTDSSTTVQCSAILTGSDNDATFGSDAEKPGKAKKKAQALIRVDSGDELDSLVRAKGGVWIKHHSTDPWSKEPRVGVHTKLIAGGQVKLKPPREAPSRYVQINAVAFGGARAKQSLHASGSADNLSAAAGADVQLGVQGQGSVKVPTQLPLGSTVLDLNLEAQGTVAAGATAGASGFIGYCSPVSRDLKVGVQATAKAFVGASAGVSGAVQVANVKLSGELKPMVGLGAQASAALVLESNESHALTLTIEGSAGGSLGVGVAVGVKGSVNLRPVLERLDEFGPEVNLDVHPRIAAMERTWIGVPENAAEIELTAKPAHTDAPPNAAPPKRSA